MGTKFLVTVEEAIRAAKKSGTEEANFAHEIYQAYIEACEDDPNLITQFAYAAVFEAGKLQGIRESENRESKTNNN